LALRCLDARPGFSRPRQRSRSQGHKIWLRGVPRPSPGPSRPYNLASRPWHGPSKPRPRHRSRGQGHGHKIWRQGASRPIGLEFGVKAPRGQGLDLPSQGQGTGPEAKAKAIKFGLEVPRGPSRQGLELQGQGIGYKAKAIKLASRRLGVHSRPGLEHYITDVYEDNVKLLVLQSSVDARKHFFCNDNLFSPSAVVTYTIILTSAKFSFTSETIHLSD